MNSAQMHLAFTHVPVILSIAGLIMLAVALLLKNTTLTKTSYSVILVAGIGALAMYLTGEGAEEAVEHLPGVSEAIISKHEEVARWALISVAATGIMALIALFSFRWPAVTRISKILVLLLSIATGGLMTQTAHLGGQIRHTEMRNGTTVQNNVENETLQNKKEEESDND
jgi:beta-lactamase regulating signal transducer with metallopeptidase domain